MNSFLMADHHILGYLVPYYDVQDMIKERSYNQGYLVGCCILEENQWLSDRHISSIEAGFSSKQTT